MARRSTARVEAPLTTVVCFEFEKRMYQIDPQLKRVYRRFVEIETSKAAEIISIWRAQHVTA